MLPAGLAAEEPKIIKGLYLKTGGDIDTPGSLVLCTAAQMSRLCYAAVLLQKSSLKLALLSHKALLIHTCQTDSFLSLPPSGFRKQGRKG